MTDQPRQQCAGAHVGAGQSDAGEQKRRLGACCAQPHVGGQRHHGACACADAINRRNDGLRTQAHGLDQVARHACELEHLGHRHLRERANDFMDITTRAKITACACEHHHLDVVGQLQRSKQVTQFGIRIKGQRVLTLGTVQGDSRHPGVKGIRKMLGLMRGHCMELRAHRVGIGDEVLHGFTGTG